MSHWLLCFDGYIIRLTEYNGLEQPIHIMKAYMLQYIKVGWIILHNFYVQHKLLLHIS